jgi:hypothetical protein
MTGATGGAGTSSLSVALQLTPLLFLSEVRVTNSFSCYSFGNHVCCLSFIELRSLLDIWYLQTFHTI